MSWLTKKIAFSHKTIYTPIPNPEPEIPQSQLRYKLGIISDAHQSKTDAGPYTNGVKHLTAALESLNELEVKEIVSCGDSCANSGTKDEWEAYLNTIEQSPFLRSQIHECNGNHDGDAPNLTLFKQYANNGTRAGNTPYFSIDLYGDHFIFMALDQNTKPSGSEVFSDAQMEWLEKEIQHYYNQPNSNLWIIEHALFNAWGSGDIISSPKYANSLNMNNKNNDKLKKLLEAHPNIIFLHGHSHIQLEDGFNGQGLVIYASPESGGCHQLHVPSICAQKELPSMDVNSNFGESECWYCEVYTDKIIFYGIKSTTGENIVYNSQPIIQTIIF